MKKIKFKSLLLFIFALNFGLSACLSQESKKDNIEAKKGLNEPYSFKKADPNGIGKWYMGREIAHVMGHRGINWLERDEREQEEQTALLISNLQIKDNDVIADIGAGSGYHVFKMAPLAKTGTIYAVDIQEEMLEAIKNKKERSGRKNIEVIKGSEKSVNLPKSRVNKVLMVDVYHEFNYPKEMLLSIHKALTKEGEIFLIEYRKEDAKVPIKLVHKMTEQQAVKEFEANGFKLKENIDSLPWQHCMIFIKA